MPQDIYLADTSILELLGSQPFERVNNLNGDIYRSTQRRQTLRFEFNNKGYFIKIHRGVSLYEILKNIVLLRLPVCGAINELKALQRLDALGVCSMRLSAFGERGVLPTSKTSFIITEELAPTVSLEDFTRNWRTDPPVPALKFSLINAVATIVRRMHHGGMNHRDLYLCHFLLHIPLDPHNPKLSIIDLHRAQIRKIVPTRWRNKDLAALYFSALDIGLTQRDLFRFLETYFRKPLRLILHDEANLLSHLNSEAARLKTRYLRKYAPRTEK